MPVVVKWFIISELSTAVSKSGAGMSSASGVSSVVSGASKFISVNVGVSVKAGISSGMSRSKSNGIGNESDSVSDISGWGAAVGIVDFLSMELKMDVCDVPTLWRARINATRNSSGRSGGNSAGVFSASGPSDGVSDFVGVSVVTGESADWGKAFRNVGIFICGNRIVISGFFVRIIKVVLAI